MGVGMGPVGATASGGDTGNMGRWVAAGGGGGGVGGGSALPPAPYGLLSPGHPGPQWRQGGSPGGALGGMGGGMGGMGGMGGVGGIPTPLRFPGPGAPSGPPTPAPPAPPRPPAAPGDNSKPCNVCGAESALECSLCVSSPPYVSTYYCCLEHQTSDWRAHSKHHEELAVKYGPGPL
jgi:hypothetical protein